MKYILLLIAIMVASVTRAQEPDLDFNDRLSDSEARAYTKSASFVEAPDHASTDVVYQQLNLEVDPAVRFIAGKVVTKVKILKETLTELHLDLSSALTIDSIHFNQDNIVYQHASDLIHITLPSALPINSVHEVTVFYQGVPTETGFGSFVVSQHNNTPVLWTLSEPYGSSDWWPCKESLSDKIDSIDILVTSPSQYRTASNGKLLSDEVSGSKRTAHWKHRYPIAPYLVAIAVTNYEIYSDFVDSPDGKRIEILNYMYPEYLETAKSKSEDVKDIMEYFNARLITYPFADEKYGHAQFGWGGGMEHQTMSFMTHLNFELVAHEMAHQWFGDYITLASWQDIWLNEGFATYMTGLIFENLKEGAYWPVWKNQQVTRITAQPDGSVFVPDTTNQSRLFNGRLSYSKGGYLLHMLRWEMGDENFFKALNNYLTDPSIANGFAKQEDLVRHLEQAADTTLTEFFQDWYYGEGYPNYHIRQLAVLGSDGGQMLQISQTPSHPSVSFFEMHVPIRVWKNGQHRDLRLYNNSQEQKFLISETAVDSIQFDPEKWLIAKAELVVGKDELLKDEQVKIIADPSNQQIKVVLSLFGGTEKLRMVDVSGRTVLITPLRGTLTHVDVSGLQTGMYIVEVLNVMKPLKEKVFIGN
ncbi:MAG TPA: M1 family aminopeptidase [Prolixibacteraceae bacterium]|nr:M1 family aminopeptidase [Prolixibacteraceae bacterium]